MKTCFYYYLQFKHEENLGVYKESYQVYQQEDQNWTLLHEHNAAPLAQSKTLTFSVIHCISKRSILYGVWSPEQWISHCLGQDQDFM